MKSKAKSGNQLGEKNMVKFHVDIFHKCHVFKKQK